MKTVNMVGKLPVHATKRYAERPLSHIDAYVIHHTAGDGSGNWESDAMNIAAQHVKSLEGGAPGIAYHRLIAPDGTIFLTQPLEAISWHAGSHRYNARGIGICLMCACHKHVPTPQQIESLKHQIAILDGLEQIPGRPAIKSHREVRESGYTECPGDSVIALIPALRSSVPPPPPAESEYIQALKEARAIMLGAIDKRIAEQGGAIAYPVPREIDEVM